MPIFTRRTPEPPPRDDYTDYREEVREDFSRCCAYCLLPEELLAGQENFQIDHYLARSARPDLITKFYNLYWACSVCNRFKAAAPYSKDVRAGASIVDTATDRFADHYENVASAGTWNGTTAAGAYTAKRLRLNSSFKVSWRNRLHQNTTAAGRDPIDWNRPSREQILDLI